MQEKLEKMLFNGNLSTFLKIDLTERALRIWVKVLWWGQSFKIRLLVGQHTKFHLNDLADGISKTKYRWQDNVIMYIFSRDVYKK